MKATQFGALLKLLREEARDKHNKPIARKTLAKNVKITETILGNIERGNRTNLEVELLRDIAENLNLTTSETFEFLLAGRGIGTHDAIMCDPESRAVYDRLYKYCAWSHQPAFVTNQYADILFSNRMLLELYNIPDSFIDSKLDLPGSNNMMRIMLDEGSGYRQTLGDKAWNISALQGMRFFRQTTLRYRATSEFQELRSFLHEMTSEFRRIWNNADDDLRDFAMPVGQHKYDDTNSSSMELHFTSPISMSFTAAGPLYMVTYIPCNLFTAERFMSLAKEWENNKDGKMVNGRKWG